MGGAGQQQVYFPGQWTCMSCGMEVCWPSKCRCFRCLAPKPFGTGADSSQPFFGKGQPRERAHPGRVPAVNPTVRPERKLPPQAPMPPGPVALEATPTVNMVDATAIARVFSMPWAFRTHCCNRSKAAFHLRRRASQKRFGLRSVCRSLRSRTASCQAGQNAGKTGFRVGCEPRTTRG